MTGNRSQVQREVNTPWKVQFRWMKSKSPKIHHAQVVAASQFVKISHSLLKGLHLDKLSASVISLINICKSVRFSFTPLPLEGWIPHPFLMLSNMWGCVSVCISVDLIPSFFPWTHLNPSTRYYVLLFISITSAVLINFFLA